MQIKKKQNFLKKIGRELKIQNIFFILPFFITYFFAMMVLLLAGCTSRMHTMLIKRDIKIDNISSENKVIKTNKIVFIENKTNNTKLYCLTENEVKKLLSNINNMRIGYNEIVEKNNMLVDNFNSLKKVAYGS